jgi:hypothetical protein
MIDAKQNSQGGNALNNFYTYNRIIEKGPVPGLDQVTVHRREQPQ